MTLGGHPLGVGFGVLHACACARACSWALGRQVAQQHVRRLAGAGPELWPRPGLPPAPCLQPWAYGPVSLPRTLREHAWACWCAGWGAILSSLIIRSHSNNLPRMPERWCAVACAGTCEEALGEMELWTWAVGVELIGVRQGDAWGVGCAGSPCPSSVAERPTAWVRAWQHGCVRLCVSGQSFASLHALAIRGMRGGVVHAQWCCHQGWEGCSARGPTILGCGMHCVYMCTTCVHVLRCAGGLPRQAALQVPCEMMPVGAGQQPALGSYLAMHGP